MKAQSKYQLSIQKELIKIGGRPQKVHHLTALGKDTRVWVWLVSKKVPHRSRNSLLVLADKAKELDCEVYFIQYKGQWTWYNKNSRKKIVSPDQPLDKIDEVIVWCNNRG